MVLRHWPRALRWVAQLGGGRERRPGCFLPQADSHPGCMIREWEKMYKGQALSLKHQLEAEHTGRSREPPPGFQTACAIERKKQAGHPPLLPDPGPALTHIHYVGLTAAVCFVYDVT